MLLFFIFSEARYTLALAGGWLLSVYFYDPFITSEVFSYLIVLRKNCLNMASFHDSLC